MKVLIIDDDAALQNLLAEYLGPYGYEIARHEEGNMVLPAIEKAHPDIILLDVMLPGKDGLEVLREIRLTKNIPVIMLTAKGDEADRIVGLELGADDYLAKPFNPRELLARMKAVLRRSTAEGARDEEPDDSAELTAGTITISPLTMAMTCSGKSVELSKTEYRIMEALMRNPGTVLSRDAIMNYAQGRDAMSFERSIDVHVSRLRAKVEEVSGESTRIKTVWGTGYMFVL